MSRGLKIHLTIAWTANSIRCDQSLVSRTIIMSEFTSHVLFIASMATSIAFMKLKNKWSSNLTLNKSKDDSEQQVYRFVLTGGSFSSFLYHSFNRYHNHYHSFNNHYHRLRTMRWENDGIRETEHILSWERLPNIYCTRGCHDWLVIGHFIRRSKDKGLSSSISTVCHQDSNYFRRLHSELG